MRKICPVKTEEIITIPVKRSWIIRVKDEQYVMTAVIAPKIRAFSIEHFGNLKFYQRFSQTVTRGLYNILEIYGLKAVSIDTPQDSIVSVRLKFVVSDTEEGCTYRSIDKKL
jgi:hypothetical protein